MISTSADTADKAADQRLEEYKFLRSELEAAWSETYSTMNFMLALIGLIVAAAYRQEQALTLLLAMASSVTIGGYRLITINTKRMWRIVGYMRCALEPNLKGIRWETRLAARQRALAQPDTPRHLQDLDSTIFGGHIFILNVVNLGLSVVSVGSVCGALLKAPPKAAEQLARRSSCLLSL